MIPVIFFPNIQDLTENFKQKLPISAYVPPTMHFCRRIQHGSRHYSGADFQVQTCQAEHMQQNIVAVITAKWTLLAVKEKSPPRNHIKTRHSPPDKSDWLTLIVCLLPSYITYFHENFEIQDLYKILLY